MNLRFKHILPVVALIVLSIFQCGKESSPTSPIPVEIRLQNPVCPDTLWAETPEVFIISVEADFPADKISVDSVKAELYTSGLESSITVFSLVDLGGSGDIIPMDKIYSAEINFSGMALSPGSYYFQFAASSRDSRVGSETVTYTFQILGGRKNLPPVIENIMLADSLSFEQNVTVILEAHISDPEGREDILEAECLIYFPLSPSPDITLTLNDNGVSGDRVREDGIFSYQLPANELFYFGEGFYTFLFRAKDSGGNSSEVVWKEVWLYSETGELPPSVKIITVPDSLKAEHGTHLFEIEVSDPNGLNDITEVYFNSYKPDGSPSSANPVHMYDDGGTTPGFDSGDEQANDGIYSMTIVITPEVGKGSYLFEFFARDKEGLLSPKQTQVIVVY